LNVGAVILSATTFCAYRRSTSVSAITYFVFFII
jgi:hypothetical protein